MFGIQGLQGGGGKGLKPFESYESEGFGVQTQNAGLVLMWPRRHLRGSEDPAPHGGTRGTKKEMEAG